MNDFNKRLNYFDHQFLRAGDFLQEQAYHIDRRRRHTSGFHTPGIVEGLIATATPAPAVNRVDVIKGWAVDDIGRELVLTDDRQNIDVSGGDGGLWILYKETLTDPSTDPGITGSMRVDEEPDLVYIISGQPNPPVGLTTLPSSAGGTLATGIYYYRVTAITQQGETVASAEASAGVNGPNGSVTLTWNPVPGPNVTYRIYRGTAPGAQNAFQTSNATNFVDTGAAGTAGRPPSVAPPHAVLIANVAGGVPSGAGPAVGMKGDDTVLSQHIKEADNLPNYAPTSNDPQFTNRGSGVKTAHIKDRAVTDAKLADDAVVTRTINDDAIQSQHIAESDGSAANTPNAGTGVKTAHLANGAVTNTKLGDNAVQSQHIAESDGSAASTPDTGTGVKTAHLANGAVTNTKLGNDAVQSQHIAESDGSAANTPNSGTGVKTAHLASGAVTGAKLADGAVLSQHIDEWDGTDALQPNAGAGVKNAHLANESVTYSKQRKRVIQAGTTSLNPGQFTFVAVGKGAGGLPLVVNIPELNPIIRYLNTALVFFSSGAGVDRFVRFENPNTSVITFTYEIEMLEA